MSIFKKDSSVANCTIDAGIRAAWFALLMHSNKEDVKKVLAHIKGLLREHYTEDAIKGALEAFEQAVEES